MSQNNRPAYNPEGLPACVVARAVQKAAHSWCYVTPEGCTFYVPKVQAERMLAAHGGAIYQPELSL